jgi:DNA replicative helicase MCM subunit Mcm2 (Cdc46/Mcm family)
MNQDDFSEILRIQQQMSQRIMQEQRTDRKIDLLNIVNDLTDGGRKRVQSEAVLLEAAASGISEQEALSLLSELEGDHVVRRPEPGFLERI